MAKVLYLIGPSRVGKSSAASYVVSHLDGVIHFDLDAELKPHQPPDADPIHTAHNWPLVHQLLEACHDLDARLALVDIGAGTQDMLQHGHYELVDWLRPRSASTVLVIADRQEVWRRYIDRPNGATFLDKGFPWFERTEYVSRAPLYEIAGTRIEATGIDVDGVGVRLLEIARRC